MIVAALRAWDVDETGRWADAMWEGVQRDDYDDDIRFPWSSKMHPRHVGLSGVVSWVISVVGVIVIVIRVVVGVVVVVAVV